MVRELSIGNDIVDLRNREPPLHPRYLERVLAPSEQDALRDSPDDLWVYWAAKEAAYKTLRRIRPGMGFHPRELVFQRELGIVTACSEMLSCSIHATSEYVSAICASEQRLICSPDLHLWITEISPLEDESAAVRSSALTHISRNIGIESSAISIEKRLGVPRLAVQGKETGALLSFAHHGRFVSSAFFAADDASCPTSKFLQRFSSDSAPNFARA